MIGILKNLWAEKTASFVLHLLYKIFIALSCALILFGFIYFYALTFGQNTAIFSGLLKSSIIVSGVRSGDAADTPLKKKPLQLGGGGLTETEHRLDAQGPQLIPIHATSSKGTLDSPRKPFRSVLTKFESIIGSHYDESIWEMEKNAFRRVLGWKPVTEKISKYYDRVDTSMMLSIIKAETQGRSVNQISNQKAVGLTQIKYQGAWAFLWDAMHRTHSNYDESKRIQDYFNIGIRQRYDVHLQRIKAYLQKTDIYVVPSFASEKAYRNARFASWKKFKEHMHKEHDQEEYQLAIDISSLYLDHLIFRFQNYSEKLSEMQTLIRENIRTDLETMDLKERKYAVLKQIFDQEKEIFIKEYFHQSGLVIDIEDAKKIKSVLWHKFKQSFGESLYSDIGKQMIERLALMKNKLNDPVTWYVAYNIGPSSTLFYIENGKDFPEGSILYSSRVSNYIKIFNQLGAIEKEFVRSPQIAEKEPITGSQS